MTETKQCRFIGFERLKQSVTMSQVLTRYGLLEKLRPSGDSLSGVCPLHRGHNPTQFRVSLGKNCWICFGDCHAGGSIIDFVSPMEQVGNRLYAWRSRFAPADAGGRAAAGAKPGSPADLQARLDTALREVRHLREQRDILKKRWVFSPNQCPALCPD